jgi:glycosyltransferase involved in cell wall biosynthesis
MFHEVAYPFGASTLAQNGLAAVNRLMAWLVGGAAERAFVSIPAWLPWVRSLTRRGTPVAWLPVPSGVPFVEANGPIGAIRARFGAGHPVVGHFGTYGRHVQPLLDASLPPLLDHADCSVLLIGRDSDRASRELIAAHPSLAGRIAASGPLAADALSAHISACDVMLQPYPDGVSTRRTSSMAALAHGKALVTTEGALTEPVWKESGAAVLVPVGDAPRLAAAARELLENSQTRSEVAARGKSVYERRFAIRHTIAALRQTA